jgi:REP element-mobilizing transposase RayT
LLEVLEMFAANHCFNLLADRVHHGDHHVNVFVSALPVICIPVMVCVLICNFARLLFGEFLVFKLRFWGGYLWFEGYAVRAAGIVTSVKIEEYINRS